MNLDTLESRLHQLIKRSHMNPRAQYPQLVNSSSPVGTMIPTPGMSHSGNSTMIVASSVDASMIGASAPTTVNPGSLLPSGGIHGGSFNRSDGNCNYFTNVISLCFFATALQSLLLQVLCLMDISSLLPIFPLALVETCHQWVLKQLQVK